MSNVILGYTRRVRDEEIDFVEIKEKDRCQHHYIIGKSGTGKSTLIKNMVIQDMRSGEGVAVIDPHGDLVEDLLEHVPKHRTSDVVYFNPADTEYPCGLNMLEVYNEDKKELIASALISVFKRMWGDSWGTRTEYVLYNSVSALLDYPNSTLVDVYKILIDKSFRLKINKHIKDPIIKTFWVDVFDGWNDRFASEVISPIQNKVGQLLASSLLRNIICQTKSTLVMSDIMHKKKIFFVNLSKGRIGEDKSNLLGSVIINQLYLSALARKTGDRETFHLYVDEFQNFATDTFDSILSEARKYGLSLVLAHQYINQIPEKTRHSVFGNIETMVAFRLGSTDAQMLEKEFAPYYELEALRTQQNYEIIFKHMENGIVGRPNHAWAIPPLEKTGREAKKETLIKVSRERYGRKIK